MTSSSTKRKQRAPRRRKPEHPTVLRAYRFPLEVNDAQSRKLFATKDLCWELRELLVKQREDDRTAQRGVREAGGKPHYLTCNDQYRFISALYKSDRRFAPLHSQVAQNVADRIDEGTKRWLEVLADPSKCKVRPPTSRRRERYRSFTYTQYGSAAHLTSGYLHLSKLGRFRVHDYRKMRGRKKTVTIAFADGRWWAIFTCAVQEREACRPLDAVAQLPLTGIDPGLTALATTAQGEGFDPPKVLKAALSHLRLEQRHLSRKFETRKHMYETEQARRRQAGEALLKPLREQPYSNRLRAQLSRVARLHTKVRNTREHFHKCIARRIEKTYSRVAIEEHSTRFMFANRRLARAAADRAVDAFKGHLASALGARRYFQTANQRPGIGGNSQTCLCEAPAPKKLSERMHRCTACGLEAPRDVVSANIVMQIAFGTNVLLSPASWQDVVRRGEIQEADANASGIEHVCASEISVKRQPSLTSSAEHTAGAQATTEAKTPRNRRKPLPGAAHAAHPSAPPQGADSREASAFTRRRMSRAQDV